jgi:hypothetical protein
LRQLTLDLWGRVPSVAELEALGDGEVTDAHVDQMLADEQFFTMVRRHHADLLFPNLDQFELAPVAFSLLLPALYYEYDEVSDPTRLFVLYVGLYFRGALVPCADEPATFDDQGEGRAQAMARRHHARRLGHGRAVLGRRGRRSRCARSRPGRSPRPATASPAPATPAC